MIKIVAVATHAVRQAIDVSRSKPNSPCMHARDAKPKLAAFPIPKKLSTTKIKPLICNFNNTQYADGLPVTLRFADQIGEILTAGPTVTDAPLPFKFYI